MHQSLVAAVSCEDGLFYGRGECVMSYYGLPSQPNADDGLVSSDFGVSVEVGDCDRYTNGQGFKLVVQSWKAERREYEEKLLLDHVAENLPRFNHGGFDEYFHCSTAVNAIGLKSKNMEPGSSCEDALFKNVSSEPECDVIPVVVEDMSGDAKAAAVCASYQLGTWATDKGSKTLQEECIPLVVEFMESRAQSLQASSSSDMIPTVVENFLEGCLSSSLAVSQASLPASRAGSEVEPSAMLHGTTTMQPLLSFPTGVVPKHVADQGDNGLPSCVVEMESTDSLANGCSINNAMFGSDCGLRAPALCVAGGYLPTMVDFTVDLPFASGVNNAFQPDPSCMSQASSVDCSRTTGSAAADASLSTEFHRHCSPSRESRRKRWCETKGRSSPARQPRKRGAKLATAGGIVRSQQAGSRGSQLAHLPSEISNALGAATAVPSAPALQLSPWHVASTVSYRADEFAQALRKQNGVIAAFEDFQYSSPYG